MKNRSLLRWTPLLLACSAAAAGNAPVCDPRLISTLQQYQRFIDALRYDKVGQARVLAADGSVFTASQVIWLKEQLRSIERACASGDPSLARRLADVEQLIEQHRLNPAA